MKIRQPIQFLVENHDVCYLLCHCAHAGLSTAVLSQLSTHTTLQLLINRISCPVIKVLTEDTPWKATKSMAIECGVFLRYTSASFLAKGITTCSQMEVYGLQITKHELGKLPWFHLTLALILWISLSYFMFLSAGTWSQPGLSSKWRTLRRRRLLIIKWAESWVSGACTKSEHFWKEWSWI